MDSIRHARHRSEMTDEHPRISGQGACMRDFRSRRCPRASSPPRRRRQRRPRRPSGRTVVVVKAQVHAGGRGKGGGVKVVKSAGRGKAGRQRDPRHDAAHAPDAARGQAGPQGLRRGRKRRSRTASSTSRSSSIATEREASRSSRRPRAGWRSRSSPTRRRPTRSSPRLQVEPNVGLKDFQIRKLGFGLGFDASR